MKPRPGVRRQNSRPWRMSSFHFLSLHRLGVTAQILRSSFLAVVLHPARRHGRFLRVGGYFIYRGLRHFGAASLDVLPPSGQEARPSPAYTELVEVLARATEKLSLDWSDEPCESQRFLSGSGSCPTRRKLPFFPDLHYEVSRSWKQPFSSRLTNAAAADFTNHVGSVEQGYTTVPAVEDTLAEHLSPNSAPSRKSATYVWISRGEGEGFPLRRPDLRLWLWRAREPTFCLVLPGAPVPQ